MIVGGIDFSKLAITIKAAVGAAPAVVIGYGKFPQTIIDFIIIAFPIFLLVKGMNSLKRKQEEAPQAAPPAPPVQEVLLAEIRDLLKERK